MTLYSLLRPRFLFPLMALPIMLPVRGEAAGGQPGFTLMSYNVWKSWSQVERGYEKGIESIRQSGADVVGLQESSNDQAKKIASELGWNRAESGDGSAQIVSRFPILETFRAGRAAGARIRIPVEGGGAREIVFFNCHLDFRFYGPYAIRVAGATPETVLAEEGRSERAVQMAAIAEAIAPWIAKADETPVFLTGDFNCPSHLDWTSATAKMHGGVGEVKWPATLSLEKAGLRDSYRFLHPDPAADPGTTWSAIHKTGEPQDRIDFTFHAGKGIEPVRSGPWTMPVETTVGMWGCDLGEVVHNTWPSDHKAVVTVYGFK